MSVADAEAFFVDGNGKIPAAQKIAERLAQVGLGYLTIGQPLTTLSGGERLRLKLATHKAGKGGIYVLDEPTTGLHLADVEQLLGLLEGSWTPASRAAGAFSISEVLGSEQEPTSLLKKRHVGVLPQ